MDEAGVGASDATCSAHDITTHCFHPALTVCVEEEEEEARENGSMRDERIERSRPSSRDSVIK